MKKRLLPALLALVMVLGMLPLSVFAATGDTPNLYAGISATGEAVLTDVKKIEEFKEITSAGVADSDKNVANILWFAMSGLDTNKTYTLSMKCGNDEVLNAKSITLAEDSGLTSPDFKPDSAKYLIYLSLDIEAQYNKSNLKAGNCTITLKEKDGTDVLATVNAALADSEGTWTLTMKSEPDPEPEITASAATHAEATDGVFATGAPTEDFQTITVAPFNDTENKYEAYDHVYKVTGSLEFVEGWTGYSEAEQDGYFGAIKLENVPKDTKYSVGGDVANTGTVGEDGKIIALTNIATSTDGLKTDGGKITFTLENGKQKAMLITVGEGDAEEKYLFLFGEVEAKPKSDGTMTVTISDATLTPAELETLGGTAETDLGRVTSITADNTNEKLLKAVGTAKYVKLPKFNESVEAEQSGHYMAIKVEVAVTGATVLPEKVTLTNRSDGASNGKEIALTKNGNKASETIVVWLDGTGNLDGLEAKQFMVTVADEKYIVDFTGVELEEKPDDTVAPVEGTNSGTTEAPVVSVSADAVKEAATEAIAAAKEANKGVAQGGEKVPVTIQVQAPTGTDESKVVGGGVAIDVETINSLKTGDDPTTAQIDIPLAVEVPNVGSVTVAPESLKKIVSDKSDSVEVTVDVNKTNVPDVKDETLKGTSVTEATHDSQAFKAEVKVDGTAVVSTAEAWGYKEITLVFKIGADASWNTSNIVVVHKAGENEEKITPTAYNSTTGELTVKVGHLSETIIYTPKARTVENYTISFAAGDGAGTMDSKPATKAASGATTYTIPSSTFTAPAGKEFDAWTVAGTTEGGEAIAADKLVVSGSTLTIAADVPVTATITLTATWKTAGPKAVYVPKASLGAEELKYMYGKLTISNLEAGHYYQICLDKGSDSFRNCVVLQPDENKQIVMPCQGSLSLLVLDVTKDGDFQLTFEESFQPVEVISKNHTSIPVMELVDE